jgi:hypothetical protein
VWKLAFVCNEELFEGFFSLELSQVVDGLGDEVFGVLLFGVKHDKLDKFGVIFPNEIAWLFGPVTGQVDHVQENGLKGILLF